MPFTPTASVIIREATATGSLPSLNKVAVFDVNCYHKAFSTAYYSLDDVNADSGIPKDSDAYRALQAGFKDANARSLPIYLARVAADETTLTPVVDNSEVYSFKVTVVDTTDGSTVHDAVEITYTSDVDATVAEITLGLNDAIVAAGITATDLLFVDTNTNLKLSEPADRQLILTEVSATLGLSFTTTTSAAQAFADFTSENPDDWYYATTTVRDNDWILAMADVIEATEGADAPKMFHVASSAMATIVAQTDPSDSTDLLGRLEEGNYRRTTGEWHDQADTIFPDVSHVVWVGGYVTGTKGRAFSQQCSVPEARHPILGRKLTKAEAGFVTDRNAVVRFRELGVVIYKTGTAGTSARGQGQWAQNVTVGDWTRLTQQLRVTNYLINQDTAGRQVTFARSRMQEVADVLNGVLTEGVNLGLFTGFEPVTIPDSVAFELQAQRILSGLKYTAYLAGGVNFVIVDGVLTYNEDTSA